MAPLGRTRRFRARRGTLAGAAKPLPECGRHARTRFGAEMARNWWQRLPAAQRREYERSAAIDHIAMASGPDLAAAVEAIRAALDADDRAATEHAAQVLVARICARLGLPP